MTRYGIGITRLHPRPEPLSKPQFFPLRPTGLYLSILFPCFGIASIKLFFIFPRPGYIHCISCLYMNSKADYRGNRATWIELVWVPPSCDEPKYRIGIFHGIRRASFPFGTKCEVVEETEPIYKEVWFPVLGELRLIQLFWPCQPPFRCPPWPASHLYHSGHS